MGPRNLLTRWDVSSNPGNWDLNKLEMPNMWGTIKSYTNFDFTVDEGKERMNLPREK